MTALLGLQIVLFFLLSREAAQIFFYFAFSRRAAYDGGLGWIV
jgi:phosphatidylethanolamine N-methyltransferase